MKKTLSIIPAIMIIMLVISNGRSFGQDEDNTKTQVGIGVSLLNLSDLISFDEDYGLTNSILFPIDIKNKVRFEPGFSLVSYDGDKYLTLGAGLFWKKPIGQYNLLFGSRFAISTEKYKSIAPTIGGEYFFVKKFSLGAEAQIRGIFYDDEKTWMTNTSIIIRFFF